MYNAGYIYKSWIYDYHISKVSAVKYNQENANGWIQWGVGAGRDGGRYA